MKRLVGFTWRDCQTGRLETQKRADLVTLGRLLSSNGNLSNGLLLCKIVLFCTTVTVALFTTLMYLEGYRFIGLSSSFWTKMARVLIQH